MNGMGLKCGCTHVPYFSVHMRIHRTALEWERAGTVELWATEKWKNSFCPLVSYEVDTPSSGRRAIVYSSLRDHIQAPAMWSIRLFPGNTSVVRL